MLFYGCYRKTRFLSLKENKKAIITIVISDFKKKNVSALKAQLVSIRGKFQLCPMIGNITCVLLIFHVKEVQFYGGL